MTDNFVIEGRIKEPATVRPKILQNRHELLFGRHIPRPILCHDAPGMQGKKKNRGSQGLEIVDGPCYDKCVESERKSRYFVDFRLQEVGSAANTLLYTM